MQVREDIIDELRQIANSGGTVASMVRLICFRLQIEKDVRLLVFLYLRTAFFITLAEAAYVGGWTVIGDGKLSDDDIERMLSPAIERERPRWEKK